MKTNGGKHDRRRETANDGIDADHTGQTGAQTNGETQNQNQGTKAQIVKLHRPYIPFDVRIAVARRQLRNFGATVDRNADESDDVYLDRQLALLAVFLDKEKLFAPLHLDHDPALVNRKFSQRTGKYKPDANDPRFLIYRTKTDHDMKTRTRGDGAQLSDLALRRKFKRIEKRKREGKRPKYGVANDRI